MTDLTKEKTFCIMWEKMQNKLYQQRLGQICSALARWHRRFSTIHFPMELAQQFNYLRMGHQVDKYVPDNNYIITLHYIVDI